MQKALRNQEKINVVIFNNKAYWVKDTVLFSSPLDNSGYINSKDAEPVDVFAMSEKDTKELLKIIDSLNS
jgi:hypothetical protein